MHWRSHIREVANDPVMKAAEKEAKEFNSTIGTLASSLGQDLLRAFTDSGSASDRWKNLMVHALQDVLNVLDNLIKKLLESSVTSKLGSILGGAFAPVGTVLGHAGWCSSSGTGCWWSYEHGRLGHRGRGRP